jgi:glycosyltransferase involved in cell wall biosynthesis
VKEEATRAAGRTPLRLALNWPAPRLKAIQTWQRAPSGYEPMDGLSALPAEGLEPWVLEASPRWLNPLSGRGTMWAGLDPLRFVRQLFNYRRYDALVGIDSSSVYFFLCCKRLFQLQKSVLVIDPALDMNYPRRLRLHRQALPGAEAVVVYGRVQARFLVEQMKLDRSRVHFLWHRIDTAFFDPARARLRVGEAPYILAIGNDAGRDFETLVEASRKLPMRVVIHTRRPVPGPLPPQVELRSDWIGFEALRDLYAGAQLVVVPLRDTVHASGINSLLEAMAMARHVVVSDSAGVADYVVDGENASLYRAGDADDLASVLGRFIGRDDDNARMGLQARAWILGRCDLPSYARELASVVRKMLSG